MFCIFCGKKLEAGAARCPHCGQKQEPLVNGTGFFDLSEREALPDETPQPSQKAVSDTSDSFINNDMQERHEENGRGSGFGIAVAALLISFLCIMICIAQTIWALKISQTLRGMTEEIFEDDRVHTEGEWEVVKEASCIEAGKQTKSCTSCGETLDEREIPATGHSFGSAQVATDAEADEKVEQRVCSVCGAVEIQPIEELTPEPVETPTPEPARDPADRVTKIHSKMNEIY